MELRTGKSQFFGRTIETCVTNDNITYKFSCSLDNTDMLDEFGSKEAERFTLFTFTRTKQISTKLKALTFGRLLSTKSVASCSKVLLVAKNRDNL